VGGLVRAGIANQSNSWSETLNEGKTLNVRIL
jgi:hypothetical protein